MKGLGTIRGARKSAGIFLDFDGTLSEIVAAPELAVLAAGAAPLLRALTEAYAVVAVVTGRPAADVRERLPVPGLAVLGLYGLEDLETASPAPRERARLLDEIRRCVRDVPGARMEDKERSVAVHYRGADDPARAARSLEERLGGVARRHGMVLLPGKMVLELAPAETPGKGALVVAAARSRHLEAVLYAGDDRADLDAFAALDRLVLEGVVAVKVGVGGAETPAELVAAADIVVNGPTGLLALLAELVEPD
jgi:trehalose 6-phosphate phosphatase